MNDSILESNNLYSQSRQKLGLFLNSLRRAFSGGILVELRSRFATPEDGVEHQWFPLRSDLPRHAEAKVALHLFDRRGDPSFEEGFDPCQPLTASQSYIPLIYNVPR